MTRSLRFIACICFILSGAASVSYQTIWLRDAMTYFGVITPVISSVLSVFMLGLAIGTLLFGAVARRLKPRTAILMYIGVELAIAVLANLVPYGFQWGYGSLLSMESQTSNDYLFASWGVITLILLPICTLIGATLPLIMRFLEAHSPDERNFGFLYFANLVGALIGCGAPLIFIELLGFSGALHMTAAANVAVAVIGLVWLLRRDKDAPVAAANVAATEQPVLPAAIRFVLFITGFAALGSEVVWIRAYTPALSTTVYAFAAILAIYLASNFAGTWRYLRAKEDSERKMQFWVWLMPLAALLPILGSSMPALETVKWAGLLFMIPVCLCFGFITPRIIDITCRNHPRATAIAYAYNFAGCIAGPLFTTYVLFPAVGLKGSLVFYALTLLPACYVLLRPRPAFARAGVAFAAVLAVVWVVPGLEDDIRSNGQLKRDHVGYVGATGEGMKKLLTVNGIGMTYLTTITKNMTHLPMAHHGQARSALVICFGMGTTVRSFTRWPELEKIQAVELSEGVTQLMPYFHTDADGVLHDPRVKITVDDGRRFLNRSNERYDVITIDPPPPVRAAGSGLLYADEFIALLHGKLNDGGILAHWLPAGDPLLEHAVVNAIKRHFTYVVVLDSIEKWGLHILASDTPVTELNAADYVARLPEPVKADLQEWLPDQPLEKIASDSLVRIAPERVLQPGLEEVFISDDRLYNEFFRLRRMGMIVY